MGIDATEQARRQARVAEAIASFGAPEAEYHAHVTTCAECNNPRMILLCGEGQRLYSEMMERWPIECYNHVKHGLLCPATCRDFETCRGIHPPRRQEAAR